jgi:hypothetical protein
MFLVLMCAGLNVVVIGVFCGEYFYDVLLNRILDVW